MPKLMSEFDFADVDNCDQNSVEACINAMDRDTLLIQINAGRKLALTPGTNLSEQQNRAALIMVRRLRALRETNTRVKKAEKASAPVPTLDDLADF